MNKAILGVLLLCSLFLFGQAEDFQRIDFQKGRTYYPRNLDTLNGAEFANSLLPNHVIEVNFGSTYATTTNKTDIPSMMIFISTNETILNNQTNITQFKNYECIGGCTIDSTKNITLALPLLQPFNSHRGSNANISAANGAWYLNNSNPLFLVDFNDATEDDGIETQIPYGWIGLGLEGTANNNYANSTNPMFSIKFFDYDQGNGTIYFGNETVYCNSTSYRTAVTSSNNWEVTIHGLYVNDTNITTELNSSNVASLTFDLQSGESDEAYIVLPQSYYTAFATELLKIDGVLCSDDEGDGYPACVYIPNNLNGFPTFKFMTSDNETISLEPSMYMIKEEDNGGYKSAFAPYTDPDAGPNKPQIIVLGWPYMRNFYTIFSRNTVPKIELFYAPAPVVATAPPPSLVSNGTEDSTGTGDGPLTPISDDNSTNSTGNGTNPMVNNGTNTNEGSGMPTTTTPGTGLGAGIVILIIILVFVVLVAILYVYVKVRRAKAALNNIVETSGIDMQLKSGRSADAANSIRL